MRKGILMRELAPGVAAPVGWRMGWFDPMRHVAIYFPAPLHWLARAAREVKWRVQLAVKSPGMDTERILAAQKQYGERMKLADEYARGYLEGWRECFESCAEIFEDEEESGEPWSQ
jgi:hypothetical protein